MAEKSRRRGKTIYERINDTKAEISMTEEKLSQLKIQLDNLYSSLYDMYARTSENEMRELFNLIEGRHIPLSEVVKILEQQK